MGLKLGIVLAVSLAVIGFCTCRLALAFLDAVPSDAAYDAVRDRPGFW